MTKERPILFSGAIVRAILDVRKTQTRRVVTGAGLGMLNDASRPTMLRFPRTDIAATPAI